MPDPAQCRRLAGRCAVLAKYTHQVEMVGALSYMSQAWLEVANQLERTGGETFAFAAVAPMLESEPSG
jgi:hypothetical protein